MARKLFGTNCLIHLGSSGLSTSFYVMHAMPCTLLLSYVRTESAIDLHTNLAEQGSVSLSLLVYQVMLQKSKLSIV